MAVAVKTTPETTPRDPHQQLVLGSLLEAGYILVSVWVVLAGLPTLWSLLEVQAYVNVLLADALLLLACVAVTVGVLVLGKSLEGPNPLPGQRAGAVIEAATLFFLTLILVAIGNGLATSGMGTAVEAVVTLGIAGAVLFFTFRLFTRPGFSRWLVNVEERGWFHATSYKPSQGVKVRRGTVIGLLAVGLAGVYTLVRHHTFGDAPLGLYLPFTEGLAGRGRFFLPLLYGANVMGPLLLVVLLGWVSWRVVNWPTFADFLIATEAEMNKVSWTTRKRLVQDTIVVLVTVVLMTVFLFVVDIIWIQVLRNPVLPVLEVDMKAERQKQTTQTQW